MFFRPKKLLTSNKIFVRDLILDIMIGVYDTEKTKPQRVSINVIAEPSVWPNASHDVLSETVSYDILLNHVITQTNAGHIHLIETLADRIAAACLSEPQINKITVRVEKMDIYPNAVPGVEIVRVKR